MHKKIKDHMDHYAIIIILMKYLNCNSVEFLDFLSLLLRSRSYFDSVSIAFVQMKLKTGVMQRQKQDNLPKRNWCS